MKATKVPLPFLFFRMVVDKIHASRGRQDHIRLGSSSMIDTKVGAIVVEPKTSTTIKNGFTLIELLVVIAIIGLLAGLVLPAIQGAREASRRMQCESHLRNQGLAILEFESAYKILPAGRMRRRDVDYSWAFYILPMLEQTHVYQRIDQSQPWNASANLPHTEEIIPVFRCPSAVKNFPGDTDYAGISGTLIGAEYGSEILDRGTLIYITDDRTELTLSSVLDGLSNTFCISESPDREPVDGLWVNGINTVSHDRGGVCSNVNGILSWHIGGAHAIKLDNSCNFVSSAIDEKILGALLTRSGNEDVVSVD